MFRIWYRDVEADNVAHVVECDLLEVAQAIWDMLRKHGWYLISNRP